MGERLERKREVGKDEMKGEGKKKNEREKNQHTHEGPNSGTNKCVGTTFHQQGPKSTSPLYKQTQHPEGSVECLHFL